MLDIKRLRYLEAVYRYKNFTRASEELFVSQPAISAAISALEKDLGITLVVRNSKKVVFTIEGEQFMLQVLRILKECDAAEQLIRDLDTSSNRTLHLGMSPTLSWRLLPHLYSEFFPRWKDAKIHVDEGSMHNHIEKLQDDILDITYNALPRSPADFPDLKFTPITTVQMCVIMNESHPLAKLDKIPVEALEGQAVCTLDKKSFIRQTMMETFEKHGVVPEVVSYHEQIMCMYHMIEFGNHIGFSDANPIRGAMGFGGAKLAVRPFEEPITYEAGFITRAGKPLPKIARDLIAFTQSTLDVWDT